MKNKDHQGFATTADAAYHIIKEAIFDGRLKPGDKLTRREMAKLTDCSVIPVIEALHRLENQGICESMPRWGTRVAVLDEKKLRDFTILREAIECQVVTLLCGKLNTIQLSHIRSLAEFIDTQRGPKNKEEVNKVHYQFHSSLAEYTESATLIETLERIQLFNILEKAVLNTKNKKPLPKDWHMRIVESLEKNNPTKARNIMSEHVWNSFEDNVKALS